MIAACPLECLASDGSLLVDKLLKSQPGDTRYREDQEHLDALEQRASLQQATSATGALQQIGLAAQCAERLASDCMSPFERQSLEELNRHLVSVARFLAEHGADPNRTYVRALMPSAF